MTTARFGVDPAELLAAASAAGEVADAARSARSALRAADGARVWAGDPELAAAARRAVEALVAAAEVAAEHAAWLETSLAVASESYARSDQQWVR